ncbi:MAG: hypothetical protein ABIR83_16545 [Nakamurella sp.]
MLLTKRLSLFLALAGLFNVVVWPRFAVAIWQDPRAFDGSGPTAFLWVHAVLIVTATVIGLAILAVGVRGRLAARLGQRGYADYR